MTNKRNRFYQIWFVASILVIVGLLAFMGITAVQKSMRLNISFSSTPSIKVLIQIEDPQADGGYRTIFRNDENTQIGAGLEIYGNTLQFTNSFADSEPNIGASFVLKFTNLMTNTGLKASVIGNSATANPTYVTMKASGNGVNTATMTISGSEVSTLQLMFSEYNVYTLSFSGGVSNTTAEVGSGGAYSTTLTPKEGYNIPSSVSITVGGEAIDSNSYSYDPNNGALTINREAITGDIVITAVSTLTQYTITYNLGDNVTNPNPTTYTIEDTITLQAPIKDGGYIFGGWTGSNGATPETSVTIPQGSTGDKTYTVSSWTLGDYTLMKGQDLNAKIKQTANNNPAATYSTSDSTVKSIVFDQYSDYSSTVGDWGGGIAVDIDGNGDGDSDGYIKLFLIDDATDNAKKVCYILSDGNIDAHEESTESGVYNYMFSYFEGVTSITFNNLNTSSVTNMSYMFQRCSGLTSLTLGSNFNTSNVTNMSYMFSNCRSLPSLDLGNNFNTSNVKNMFRMYDYCSKLTSLTLGSNFNTSKVEDMSYMFYCCWGLTSLTLGSNFNTSNVTNMSYMFSNCSKLTSLTLGSNFNTSNVTDMNGMFEDCSKLTSLNLSNFDTSNVTSMDSMFSGCNSLTSLNVSNFNTSNVTSMSRMFSSCGKLTSLNVSNFNTSNVTSMSRMFYNCWGLTSLTLGSNFNTSKVEDMSRMFQSCTSLTTIYVRNSWLTDAVTTSSSMFLYCTKLVGGNGTKYTSSYTDKTYARIDEPGTPGYFTSA